MERLRQYRRPVPGLRQTPESAKRTRRKARITAYGLTEATFAQLLEIQENSCAMCREPLGWLARTWLILRAISCALP
jgi:hypothetical protein